LLNRLIIYIYNNLVTLIHSLQCLSLHSSTRRRPALTRPLLFFSTLESSPNLHCSPPLFSSSFPLLYSLPLCSYFQCNFCFIYCLCYSLLNKARIASGSAPTNGPCQFFFTDLVKFKRFHAVPYPFFFLRSSIPPFPLVLVEKDTPLRNMGTNDIFPLPLFNSASSDSPLEPTIEPQL